MDKRVIIFSLLITIIGAINVSAQFQLNANGSVLKGGGENSSCLIGMGLSGKMMLTKTVAIGAGFRTFPQGEISPSYAGNLKYSSTNANTQFFGSLDILLGCCKTGIQPYVGADFGTSSNPHTFTSSTSNSIPTTTQNNKTFVYLAPKVGVNVKICNAIGFFVQASYGVTNAKGATDNGSLPGSTTKPIDRFFQADAGLYLRFKGKK